MTVEEIENKYEVAIEQDESISLVYGSPALFPVIYIPEHNIEVLCASEDVSMKPTYISCYDDSVYEDSGIWKM